MKEAKETKKDEVLETSPGVEVVATTAPVVEPVPATKVEPIYLTGMYRSRDEEGDKIKVTIESKGDTVEEALAGFACPKGFNALMNLKVKKGAREYNRALAPHKARQILEQKDAYEFNRLFRPL